MPRSMFLVLTILVFAILTSCSSSQSVLSPDSSSNKDVGSGRTEDILGVAVSPQMLLLSSDQGGMVVVHTNIPYGTVNLTTLTLNGVVVDHTKADLCGNLVAYFQEHEIKALVTPPKALMTLRGKYVTGETFAGYDTVKVKE